jgi:phosphonate transport system ATP-binding protein
MIYELDRVTRSYYGRAGVTRALDGVSFRVEPGERLAILGASGAGKTSLFRLLNGSAPPSGGALRFDGCDVLSMSARDLRAMRRRVGVVFQLPELVPSLTVRDNALAGRLGHWSAFGGLRARFWPPRNDVARARDALDAVDLLNKAEARAEELSGGQQQRVAIARVLVQDPEVVLADEPFASLDPALVETVAELLFGLAARSRTLIVALHDVELALRYFPRIVGLRGGKVLFDAPPAEAAASLAELYSAGAHAPESRTTDAAFASPLSSLSIK